MITESDFIIIPYSPDLTQVGINYAFQSLQEIIPHRKNIKYNEFREIVARKAIELALKRYLNNSNIPHEMIRSTPFSDPNNYDIIIGGRCCNVKSFLLTKKRLIRSVRKEPQQLLKAPAFVSVHDEDSKHLTNEDIYIFAILNALITPGFDTLKKAISADQPIYMLHAFPHKWTNPKNMRSFGRLTIKSNLVKSLEIKLGGKDYQNKFQTEHLKLGHQTQLETKKDYYSLTYFASPNLPESPIYVYSANTNDSHLIESNKWRNIWVYGLEIIFAGFITLGEFRNKAIPLPVGTQVYHQSRLKNESYSISIQELYSLDHLFESAKAWSLGQNFV